MTQFSEKVTEQKMCFHFFFLQFLFGTFFILRIIQLGVAKNVKTSSCKVDAILAGF
jgi:hypothetical protein